MPDPPPDAKGDPKQTPPDTKRDPDIQPCLKVPPDPSGVEPCLEVMPCLSPPVQPETKAGPCLEVPACLSPPARAHKCLSAIPVPERKPSDGGMARTDVIDRLLRGEVLPPDVAARLRDRSGDA